jgi:hypothetical protein
MKWEGNRESDNVEDRRDDGGGSGGGGIGGRHIGIGTVVVALAASYFLGVNPMTVLNLLSGGGGSSAPTVSQAPPRQPPAGDQLGHFVKTVLGSTEDVWTDVFAKGNATYKKPKLDLFRGSYPTACGQGETAMGPFYCPGDQKVYIDLAFYETLKNKLGAPGEFAEAYVIAHEVGHHVQNLLGISGKVDAMRQRVSKTEYNALSVRLELQADCFAGIWGHYSQDRFKLDQSDIASAMNAAAKIGDDALQRAATGRVVPESFTHGTSAQRQHWFDTGFKSGSVKSCDTFAVGAP